MTKDTTMPSDEELHERIQPILDDIKVTIIYQAGSHPSTSISTGEAAYKIEQLFAKALHDVEVRARINAWQDMNQMFVALDGSDLESKEWIRINPQAWLKYYADIVSGFSDKDRSGSELA